MLKVTHIDPHYVEGLHAMEAYFASEDSEEALRLLLAVAPGGNYKELLEALREAKRRSIEALDGLIPFI